MAAEVRVNVTQVMPTVGTEVMRELVLPVRYYKTYSSGLLREDFVDLGVITSPEIAHKYDLLVQNRFGRHAVITRVAIEKKAVGMLLKVGTVFGYKVAMAPKTQPFILLTLHATPAPDTITGHVFGTIHIYVDIAGTQEKVSVDFFCGYQAAMLGSEEDLSFKLPKSIKDGKIVYRYKGSFLNNFDSDLIIKGITFNDIENNQATTTIFSPVANRRVILGERFEAFSAQFTLPVIYYESFLSRGSDLATVSLFDSFASVLVKYYTISLMCGYHSTAESRFEKCQPTEKVDFSHLAVGHRKIKTIDILNPTMESFIIRRVEFASGNGNVEVSFENRTPDSMKSYFKKATKTINTFIMIQKNAVVSLRIKVKPKVIGNFRETVVLVTNHGDYIFAITYKGVQGEILFTPSTLRFDLFYPIESDEKPVMANNKFGVPVEIQSAWSPQPYIYPHLRTSLLGANNKEAFMGVILDLADDTQIASSGQPRFMTHTHESFISIADLAAYDEQARGWERILKEAKTEISGEVIVQTDILNDLKIMVKGHLRKASFLLEDKLTISPLEENRSHAVNITLINPTERDITMQFYLADSRMLDMKSLQKKAIRRLSRQYSKFKEEHICLSHSMLEEDTIKYYATVMFDKVSFKNLPSKRNPRRVCFVVNHPRPAHNRFFNYGGNYLFNVTRLSRKDMIQDSEEIFLLKDVLMMSRRNSPRNPESLHGLSLWQKLKLIVYKALASINLRSKYSYKNSPQTKYLVSMTSQARKNMLNKQEFFINKKFRGKNVTLKAGQTRTLPLLRVYPREAADNHVSLLIKNNYSRLSVVPLSASVGKVRLIIQKVIYVNEGSTTSIIQKKEDYSKIIFTVHSSDLIQKVGRESKKYIFKKSVRRLYEVKNSGNLPVAVKSISVDNQGCNFNGFAIVNCEPFKLNPGQTHKLEIDLLQTFNFQAELKKDVYFMMEGKAAVFSFEVRPTDSLIPELATYGFVSSITHVFRLIAFIFSCILMLILFRHYHEKPGNMSYYISSVAELLQGDQLFIDNITDLKKLEETVKFQKFERQKANQLRNIGMKQMMYNFKEASSREVSFNAGLSDAEGPKESTQDHILPGKQIPEVKSAITEDALLINFPKTTAKKKKQKKEKYAGVPADYNQRTKEQLKHEDAQSLGNILDGIDKEPISYHKEYLQKDKSDKKEQYRKTRPEEKESGPIKSKPSDTNRKESYREDKEKISAKLDESKEKSHLKEDSIPQNQSRTSGKSRSTKPGVVPSTPEQTFTQDPQKSKTDREKSVKGETSQEENKPIGEEIPDHQESIRGETSFKEILETSGKDKYQDRSNSEHWEKKDESYKNLITEKHEVDHHRYKGNQRDHEREEDQEYVRRDPSYQRIDNYKPDSRSRPKYEKEPRRGKDKKREVIYYQRVEKQEEEFPSLNVYNPKDSKAYYLKTKPEEEEYIPKQPHNEDSQSFTPPLLVEDHHTQRDSVQEGPKDSPPKYRQGGNFSHDQHEEIREEHIGLHNVSGFDQNISVIQKVEDQDPDTSGIGILKATSGYKEPIEKKSEISESHSSSGESYEDVERSHEKIRKLMEETEDVKPDVISLQGNTQGGRRVIGVIGEKAAKKPAPAQENSGSSKGLSRLGFGQSANTYSRGRGYNQFAGKEPEPKNTLFSSQFNRYQMPASSGVSQYDSYNSYTPKLADQLPGSQTLGQRMGSFHGHPHPQQDMPYYQYNQPKIYSNQYGSFVTNHRLIDQNHYNIGMQEEQVYYEDDYYYANDDANMQQMQEFSEGDAEIYQQPKDSSFSKPFKAAITNNPFTLSRLGGHRETYDSYESGSHGRGLMRPPPGLTMDEDLHRSGGTHQNQSQEEGYRRHNIN